MQTLLLEPGDLVQIKSTDLPPGQRIKLQAQSTSFLDITDPKAVLENAFRNFSCLTKGDVFTFSYNDQVYEMAVLETRPETPQNAISVLETDLEVDFATPVGYEEPKRVSGTSTPSTTAGGGLPLGGTLHAQGTMAQAINYGAIAPESADAALGAKAVSSNFLLGGHRLNAKKGSKAPTPQASTPVSGASANPSQPPPSTRNTNGPQPLRLPPGKLFFGYAIKPLQKHEEQGRPEQQETGQPHFRGGGQTLRGATKKKGAGVGGQSASASGSDADTKPKRKDEDSGQAQGRTLGKSNRPK